MGEHVMAGDLDAFDEFFDFSHLDQGGDGHVIPGPDQSIGPSSTPMQWDLAMDWQPTVAGGPVFSSEDVFNPSMHQSSHVDCSSMPEVGTDLQPLNNHNITESLNPSHPPESFQSPPMPIISDPLPLFSDSAGLPSIQSSPAAPLKRSGTATRKPALATRKGASTRIPLEAKQMLEEEFSANPYPCSWEIDVIAHQANLDVKRVRNWFNNTRARKKGPDALESIVPKAQKSTSSLASQLSRDSLEALDKQSKTSTEPPQPPLALYLAQSYQEEACTVSDIQAAIDNGPLNGDMDLQMDTASSSKMGRSGSIITSVNSSDGTAPTTYSSGSNMSSFNRDRRRGRRRMEWKTSPYTRTKLKGLNSAGVPQEDLPFCCTFCPRAFKTKYEWNRHEDSVHALRTTWICCDNKNNVPLLSCPFCGQLRPDEYHMAGHKYQQCRNKPESQRTFYRRDHFIQHLHHVHFANVKHPSARLGCQARIMDSEGNNFGCKDLAVKWRRFGAPIKADDPMLHCGFCGRRSKNWGERCEHVAEHMYAGELDRSAWWQERLENYLENLVHPDAVGPFRCRYCLKIFENNDAMNKHSHCRVWSCRFLRSFDDIATEDEGPPLYLQFPSPRAHHCNLCGAGYRSFHVEHAQHYHRYRHCDQMLYTSEDEFLQHLHESHGASPPSSLKGNSILEHGFCRNKGGSFEPLHFDEIMQGCRDTTTSKFYIDPVSIKDTAMTNKEEPTSTPKARPSTPARKKMLDQTPTGTQKSVKIQRQRSDSSSSKPPPQGPRFFRLSPLVPFLSSRIYYLRSAMPASLFPDGKAVLDEIPKSHIATLVMSSGLVGLAGVHFPLKMQRDGKRGPVEFAMEEDDDE